MFIGAAPQADLVVVKTDFALNDIVDGVSYVFNRAGLLGEPAVVNLSLGPNDGPRDGTSPFETQLDALTGAGQRSPRLPATRAPPTTTAMAMRTPVATSRLAAPSPTRWPSAGGLPSSSTCGTPASDRLRVIANYQGNQVLTVDPPVNSFPNQGVDGVCNPGDGPRRGPAQRR